jgi:hypothetical protein
LSRTESKSPKYGTLHPALFEAEWQKNLVSGMTRQANSLHVKPVTRPLGGTLMCAGLQVPFALRDKPPAR